MIMERRRLTIRWSLERDASDVDVTITHSIFITIPGMSSMGGGVLHGSGVFGVVPGFGPIPSHFSMPKVIEEDSGGVTGICMYFSIT
jgi:hypothetical protein